MTYNAISPDSHTEVPYRGCAINREYQSIDRWFDGLGGQGLLATCVDVARSSGRLAILDAGCGTGLGLITLKQQVSARSPLDEMLIKAHGISLIDYRSQFPGDEEEEKKLSTGYVNIRLGNLATIDLSDVQYDLAYSLQVLVHNTTISPIVHNVMASLRKGGVYYFDTSVGQEEGVRDLATSLDTEEWQFITSITPLHYAHKLTRMEA